VKKALFVHQGRLSFVEKDLDILRQGYDVEELIFRGLQGMMWCALLRLSMER